MKATKTMQDITLQNGGNGVVVAVVSNQSENGEFSAEPMILENASDLYEQVLKGFKAYTSDMIPMAVRSDIIYDKIVEEDWRYELVSNKEHLIISRTSKDSTSTKIYAHTPAGLCEVVKDGGFIRKLNHGAVDVPVSGIYIFSTATAA